MLGTWRRRHDARGGTVTRPRSKTPRAGSCSSWSATRQAYQGDDSQSVQGDDAQGVQADGPPRQSRAPRAPRRQEEAGWGTSRMAALAPQEGEGAGREEDQKAQELFSPSAYRAAERKARRELVVRLT